MAVPQARQQWLDDGTYDLIVIGGGINGAGIARDAAQRGMRVALLEKNDFSSGTTQAPTRLIHGGLRYLEHFEFSLVFESLREREILLRIAPHLVQPLPFLIPIYKHSRRGRLLVNMGMVLYDMLSWNKSLPHYKPLSAKQVLAMEPGLAPDELQGGVMYYDCQVDWPERLCLANALAARADGAFVRNYAEVIAFTGTPTAVSGVRVRETLSGKEYELRGRLVVNAAGPWADAVTRLLNGHAPRRVLQTKGTHLVVPPFANAPQHAIYIEAKSDGRPYFVVPWVGTMLIGTTDDPYEESLDDVRPTEEEARYLLAEVNTVFPGADLTIADVQHTYTGLRGLPLQKGKSAGAVSRRSFIYDHEREAGVSGLVSIIGGKLTAYRSLAEEVVDHAQNILRLKHAAACRTRTTPLPGGDIADFKAYVESEAAPAARRYDLQPAQVEHLIELYGTQHRDVLALLDASPELSARLLPSRPDIAAQVVFAVEREMAHRLSDFFVRRTGLVTFDGGDEGVLQTVARIFAARLRWNSARTAQEIAAWRDERARHFTLQVPGPVRN